MGIGNTMVRLLTISLLLLFGCGPTHYLKKAERALKKAEQLGAVIKQDTVYVERTIIIPEHKTDTLIKRVDFRDTIRLETERVKWKVKVNTVEKEIFVEAKCKADTVRIEVPVETNREIKAGYGVLTIIQWSILALLVGALLSKLFWK
jgi:hypothetical protein